MADPTLVYVSAVSVWEIAIKTALGRLRHDAADLVNEIEAGDFLELPITARHAQVAGALARHTTTPSTAC